MFGSKKMEAKRRFWDRKYKTKNKTKIFPRGATFWRPRKKIISGLPPPINNEPSLIGKMLGVKKIGRRFARVIVISVISPPPINNEASLKKNWGRKNVWVEKKWRRKNYGTVNIRLKFFPRGATFLAASKIKISGPPPLP